MRRRAVVAATASSFGWGCAGKLDAILSALDQSTSERMDVLMVGCPEAQPVVAQPSIRRWIDWPSSSTRLGTLMREESVAVALVVGDPLAQARFAETGVPTVFVDSLPYLWTSADDVAYSATSYCAQLCDSVPQPAWAVLRKIRRLTWVEAILPTGSDGEHGRRRRLRRAVVNFGGLHAPLEGASYDEYVQLVYGPTITALRDAGVEEVDVCGNVESIVDHSLGIAVQSGQRSQGEFHRLLLEADLLLTSPGLTTLLEASAMDLPTICLPPQNLSQIFNGSRFALAIGSDLRIEWPAHVLNMERVELERERGENAAVAVVYEAIRAAHARICTMHTWLDTEIRSKLAAVERPHPWTALCHFGRRGAEQIVAELERVVRLSGSARQLQVRAPAL